MRTQAAESEAAAKGDDAETSAEAEARSDQLRLADAGPSASGSAGPRHSVLRSVGCQRIGGCPGRWSAPIDPVVSFLSVIMWYTLRAPACAR